MSLTRRSLKLAFASLSLAVFALATAAPTYADAIQLTSAAQLSPGGLVVDLPGASGARLPSPLVVPTGANTVTFTSADGTSFLRENNAGGFNFLPGTELLQTTAPSGVGNGPLTISFGTGVAEFGLGAQNNFVGTSLFTFSVFNNATLLRTFTAPGNGFVSFLGARATGGDVITRVVISGTSTSPDGLNNFSIGNVTFVPVSGQPQPVPEPATMLLLGTGLAGVVAKVRRRRGQSND